MILQKRTAETAEIIIGKFTIKPWREGSIWIGNEEGEGMQVWIDEFEKALDQYWRENF